MQEQSAKILWQDDPERPSVVIFKAKSEVAAFHYLVVPVGHVQSVKTLTPAHLPLLKTMSAAAKQFVSLVMMEAEEGIEGGG